MKPQERARVKADMKPEERARVKIDRWLEAAGWQVVGRDEYTPCHTASAVREGLLEGNRRADYILFLDSKAVGVLEAKREETDVSSDRVTDQVQAYACASPSWCPTISRPLPLLYKSNGCVLLFRDSREKNSEYKKIASIHTPKEVARLLGIEAPFAGLPFLRRKGLRECQYEAVCALEDSFRAGQTRALIVMATGAGKTYAACLAAYRMLAYTPMRRVLFLVDRNNLGRQAEGEYSMFRLTESGDAFNTLFTVNRLKSAEIPADSNVVISTIQRLYAFLRGDRITDTDEDDGRDEDPVVQALPDHPRLPHDYFDLIIIDESHRSIYRSWRPVLEYFSTARLVGLTATPGQKTVAFFNSNTVATYTYDQSVVDGVNVAQRVYRIRTRTTEDGGVIREGDPVSVETRYTGTAETVRSREDSTYTPQELNRSVINPAEIELVLSTYRDAVYTELFNDPQREPNMDYLPKTLIFALDERHATNIVNIAKEVFGRTDDRFVQKITSSAGNSDELIRQFRNDRDFRIAVTCTLVATGTDIKPLEVVMFMRDVNSLTLYTQMKGRGVRTIGDEQLRVVTPNAVSKDCFFLVDAVGVTEHTHTNFGQLEPAAPAAPAITLRTLLEQIAHGYLPDTHLRLLADRLARLHNRAGDEQRQTFARLAGAGMQELARRIYDALGQNTLPPFADVNEHNSERKGLVAPLANHPKARTYMLTLAAGFVTTLMPGEDTLISAGFTQEEAQSAADEFEQYCRQHRDQIEALRIIYNNAGEPVTYSMLKDLENKLKEASGCFTPGRLWNYYAILRPGHVRRNTLKAEREALTNLIQLVRFAFRQTNKLECLIANARQMFELWCGQKQSSITTNQRQVMEQIVNYLASNGMCSVSDIRQGNRDQAAQMVKAFGNDIQKADEAILSLYNFVITKKTA